MFTTLVIVHEMAFPLSSLKLSIYSSCTFFSSSAAAAEAAVCCVVLWQLLFFHLSLLSSISILLFHCLFTSYRHPCSITLSPLAMSYSVFSLCCLLSHSSSWLAITAYLLLSPPPPHPVSCRVHQILSALSGTMETRKLLTVTLTLV